MTDPEIRFYGFDEALVPPPPSLEGALIYHCGTPVALIGKLDPITREYSVIHDPEGEK